MIPLFKVYIDKWALNMLDKTLNSGYISQGPVSDLFEKKLSEYLGSKRISVVNSCTSAIHLVLHHLKNKYRWENPEIITTPVTCAATNIPMLHLGYDIRWSDVDLDCNIDLMDVENKITANTKVIMVVHWGGNLVDYKAINNMLKRIGRDDIHIIEDCAHSFGSTYCGQHIHEESTKFWKCYSFQAIKTLTCGDGGAIYSPTDEDEKEIRKLRWFGLDRDNKEDFRSGQDIRNSGFKFNLNDISASIGLSNLGSIDNIITSTRTNAFILYKEINKKKYYICSPKIKEIQSSNWLFTILVDNNKKFIKYMLDNDIEAHFVHTRNDVLSCFKYYNGYEKSLHNVSFLENKRVCIPCGWWLSSNDLEHIIEKVNNYNE